MNEEKSEVIARSAALAIDEPAALQYTGVVASTPETKTVNSPSIANRPRCAALLVALGLGLPSLASGQTAPASPSAAQQPVISPSPDNQTSVEYPKDGQGAASVILEVTVLTDGTIRNAKVRQGQEPFASTALRGIENWTFIPATRGGEPLVARILIKIDFGEPEPIIQPQTNSEDEQVDVIVLGRRAEIGTTFIPIEEARKVPGAFSDPFRAAAIQPGVAPVLSGLPYFFVRGAPPGNVGYLLDGIRVPFLFHVGAGPSVIAPSLVERVDLFPSAYPAELGRYSGSILSGTTQGLSPAPRGEVLLRAFDASALVEQPIGKATVLAAGRIGYLQPLLNRVAPEYDADYWDYQARVGYQISPRDAVTLFAFGAADTLFDKSQGVTLFDAEFHRLDLNWSHEGKTGRTRVAVGIGQDRVLAGASPNDDRLEDSPDQSVLRTRGANVRIQTTQELTDSIRLRAGLDYRIDEMDNSTFEQPLDPLTPETRTDLTTATYLDFVLQPLDNLEIVPGIRLETGLWRDSGYLYPEPRLATRVNLWPGVAWTSSFGVVHQLPTATIRGPGILPSELSNSVQEALQIAETLNFVLPAGLTGHVTGFYSTGRGRTNSLASRNFGAEAFLRRDLTEKIGFILSYTLSRSDDTDAEGVRRISEFDRTHLASASLGIDLGAGIRLGARGYVASGGTYLVRCSQGGCATDPQATEATGRLPTFLRADVRLDKRWNFDSGSYLTLAAEWFNASQSSESYDAVWNDSTRQVELITQSAITIPSINIEAGF